MPYNVDRFGNPIYVGDPPGSHVTWGEGPPAD